jgi:predicted glycoside hydrolase/deacetylase ChbG (UPF0249 family)
MVLLVADDYAMTEGVSAGIEQLAAAGRLSATSVMTTSAHWPAHAPRIRALRGGVAIGLHIDLTLLGPLGPMPRLAPGGKLPAIGALTRAALMHGIDAAEIAAETERQLDAFERQLGFPPDHIDGHQHVHALPGIRDGVLAALKWRYPERRPLLRIPSDTLARIRARKRHAAKAAVLSALASGYTRAVAAAGFPANAGFAGVSDFADAGTLADFAAAALAPGDFQMIMCHPGFPDDELKRIDPVVERRRSELDLLGGKTELPFRVWRPERAADGAPVDWRAARAACKRGGRA